MSLNSIKAFRHTGIVVSNMEESKHFYETILGLEVIQEFSDNSPYVNTLLNLTDANVSMCKLKTNDDFVIELLYYPNHKTINPQLPVHNNGICHLAFEIANADMLYDTFIDHNINVLSQPIVSSEKFAKVFFAIDPNNVHIECVEIIKNENV